MIDKAGLHKLLDLTGISDSSTVLIYAEEKGNRLDYVCEFIFKHVLKVNSIITADIRQFESSNVCKINYSNKKLDKGLQILPSGLLSETDVTEKKPEPRIKNDLIYFFANASEENFHFDIFSAVFYFISRYEEWQNFTKDQHGRFELKESILFSADSYGKKFHLKPVVDLWIEEFKKALLEKHPSFVFPKKTFKSIATIDVDNLYAYKSKGLIRTSGAALKDLVKFDMQNLQRRLNVVKDKIKDPFDIYESFSKFCHENKLPLIFFFLFKTGTKYDRTVDPESESYSKVFDVIKSNKALIGLHPSYYSAENDGILKKEVLNFSKKLNDEVKISRQHYLKFDIKKTPALLLKNNILADFSMGFASGAGFRAGTSHPFYFYDFNSEAGIELLMVPFCAMDGAYFVYNNISADEAYLSILKLKEEIKKVNGLFITVFHERTFAEHLYPGFGEMYKKLLLG